MVRSFHNHSSAITDIKGIPAHNPLYACSKQAALPSGNNVGEGKEPMTKSEKNEVAENLFEQGTFLTCSADSTIRLWSFSSRSTYSPGKSMRQGHAWDPSDSEALGCIFVQQDEGTGTHASGPSVEVSRRYLCVSIGSRPRATSSYRRMRAPGWLSRSSSNSPSSQRAALHPWRRVLVG